MILLCTENFPMGDSFFPTFWSEIHGKLRYLLGRPTLTNRSKLSADGETIRFLLECSDAHFLDFVELIFQSEFLLRSNTEENQLVDAINQFLQMDDLPYALTGFVFEEVPSSLFGQKRLATQIAAYPQIIRRDDEILHKTAIEPTLTLLADPAFSSANKEFLEALVDYRKGDYSDCVVKCGSSLESVMKIICDRNRWAYNQNDTAEPLLQIIFPRTNLESFYKQPLMLVATIRNRLSSAHGAGNNPRMVSKHVANFVINSTASTILLLVEETNP